MLNKEASPERAKLEFKDTVLSSFKFLSGFGLRPVEEKTTFVRYESPEVFVNVYHGRASFELGVEVGRLTEPNEKVTLHDLVAWAGAEKTEGFGQHVMFQVSSRDGVKEFVPKLARLLENYGVPFLKAEGNAYRAVGEIRSQAAVEYENQVHLRDVRKKAQVAWHAKDYARVVELISPLHEELTEVEAKKLAYSEQQVSAAEGVGSRSSSRKKR
jgi:uncharacterized protein (DUF1330 family)